MATFPTANVHRRNRRRLGRGQSVAVPALTVAVTSTGTTNATLTYNRPVVVSGMPDFNVATLTPASYTVVSPTVVRFTMSGNVATKGYTYDANDPNVRSGQGVSPSPVAGTFP